MVESDRDPYWLEDHPEYFDPPQTKDEVMNEIRGRAILDYQHNGFKREYSNDLGHFIYSKDGQKITNAEELQEWLDSPANKPMKYDYGDKEQKLGFQHFTFSRQIENTSLTSSRGLRPSFKDTETELWRYKGSEQNLKRRVKKGFIPERIEEIDIPDESNLKLVEFNSICKCKSDFSYR